ncbi:hypothetical protein JKP88DRAFT_203917 [Tribonema minus]|uniref:Uncharacterized protein n=1 Tax=Tribonema minus TaxID=303371 RepID=A0A835YJX9_9STRA|nr:hypothetical protein JKP88DRAFT_203917 [Tribonema minus]
MASEPQQHHQDATFAPVDFSALNAAKGNNKAAGVAAAALLPFLVNVGEASAKGGELGVWEGRSFALLHPLIMGTLFGLSGYAALLGLEWRELRTMGTTIGFVKDKAPVLSTGEKAGFPFSKTSASINSKIGELEASDPQVSALKADLAKLSAAAAVDEEYAALQERRKALSKKDVRDKHYEVGSLILGLGVFAAIEGPVNTYIRAGKLFPGPHLYAGAGIVVAWGIAASLVQQMQKGNEWARLAHIGINFGILGFFAWQVNTGLGITAKVLEFTKWP